MTNYSNHGHGNETYAERNARNYNYAEDQFEKMCVKNNISFQRIGFDEKNGKVPNFFRLAPALRHLPDYVINWEANSETLTRVVSVKGTNKFKLEDYERIPKMKRWYSSDDALLYFCFIMKGKAVWKTADEVVELYERQDVVETEDAWESDNKIFRVLPLF